MLNILKSSLVGILLYSILQTNVVFSQDNDTRLMANKKLRQKLLTNYDKNIRPISQNSNMTIVTLTLAFLHSFQLNEKNETLTIDGFFRLKWFDPRWTWDPNEFGKLDFFSLREEDAWLPDILIYESVPAQKIDDKLKTRIMLQNTGTVIYAPRGVFKSLCSLSYEKYPKDVQTCNVTFGSWSQDSFSIDLQIADTGEIYGKKWRKNNNWILKNYKVNRIISYRNGLPNPFVNIVYTFKFQRRPFSGNEIVGPPIIVATIMMLSMFWLPPSADKKLTLGATALFILIGLLLYLAASAKSPIVIGSIVSPVRSVIYIVVSAILSQIFVMILTTLTIQPPDIMTNTLYGKMGGMLCLYAKKRLVTTGEEDQSEDKKNPEDIWHRMAMATDRFLFILFLAIVIFNQF